MIRMLFWLHRYLGIAVGALMAMWCISGVIMMYVAYPSLDDGTRLRCWVYIYNGTMKGAEPLRNGRYSRRRISRRSGSVRSPAAK